MKGSRRTSSAERIPSAPTPGAPERVAVERDRRARARTVSARRARLQRAELRRRAGSRRDRRSRLSSTGVGTGGSPTRPRGRRARRRRRASRPPPRGASRRGPGPRGGRAGWRAWPRSRAANAYMYSTPTPGLLERLEHRGEPARAVRHVDREHLGDVHHHAGRLEHLPGALPVLHDEAQDPELRRCRRATW